jgi:hypothetical protein
MFTINGIYDNGNIVLDEKYRLKQKCEVVIVFSKDYKLIEQKTDLLNSFLNKINDDNIHAEVDFGEQEGSEIW